MHNVSGWFLMAFFLSIAFAFRGSKTLRGLSYTMMILGAVSVAMYHTKRRYRRTKTRNQK